MAKWITKSTDIPYQNNWIRIREDQVVNPAGSAGVYGVVELKTDAAYAVPVTSEGTFVLTRQYRYPLERETWELPSGQTEGQNPTEAARREMIEETGYDSTDLLLLSSLGADTGLSSSYIHVVLAFDAHKITDDVDETDGILEVREFSSEELDSMMKNGELICPHSIAALCLAKLQLETT